MSRRFHQPAAPQVGCDLASQRFVHARASFLTFALAVVFLAALAFAPATFAADDNKVIYPAGSASANSAPAAAPGSGSLGNLTLIVGLVLAAVGGWFVWRGRLAAPTGRVGAQLAIGETRSLGNRQYLVVATYEDKKFLLGVCPGRIDLLAPLHDGATPPEKPRS